MFNLKSYLASKLVGLKPFFLTDLGFENTWDWVESSMGAKTQLLSIFGFVSFAGLSVFIENNVWEDPGEIYFLLTLIGIDLTTGVWRAIKFKADPKRKFRSRRICRTVGKLVTYSILLYMAYNMDKNLHGIFFWMPYSFLGMFYATEAWSIIENLSDLGFLNKGIVDVLKEKLDFKNLFKKKEEGEGNEGSK